MPLGQPNFPIWGAPPIKHVTGRYYPSHMIYSADGSAVTTTATRLYYTPYLITEIRSYAGFVIRNTGVGDTGERVRMGLYLDRTQALVKAATEVTFAGAAADNVTADAFTPTELGWHWICAHFNSATAIKIAQGVGMIQSAAGFSPPNFSVAQGGVFAATGDVAQTAPVAAWYVDTTYAALASTMVAATATTNSGVWLALKA